MSLHRWPDNNRAEPANLGTVIGKIIEVKTAVGLEVRRVTLLAWHDYCYLLIKETYCPVGRMNGDLFSRLQEI